MKKIRVVVAGGRDFNGFGLGFQKITKLLRTITQDFGEVEVVCGEARGADTVGKEWARDNGVPVASFPADWEEHGKAAGHIRNAAMAEYGTHLIAFWDGKSRGTKNMIDVARSKGLKVALVRYHTYTDPVSGQKHIRKGWK